VSGTFAAPLDAIGELRVRDDGTTLWITASVPVRAGADYLAGHFPGLPVFPGVFTVEAVGQAVDRALACGGDGPALLREVRSVRFTGAVMPDDEIVIEATVCPDGEDRWRVRAVCRRGDGVEVARVDAGLERAHAGDAGPTRIRALLPQRFPLLLIDRVLRVDPGHSISAIKAVTVNEPCYAAITGSDHAYPVSLMIESFGQAAALLWLHGVTPSADDRTLILGGARGYEVEHRVYPGDVMRHEARLEYVRDNTAFATGETWVGDRRVARVRCIVAAHRPSTALAVPRAGPVVVPANAPEPAQPSRRTQ
jgi:3-hydroxymyristoyl/3-hydroxydecanoyl-(acyl carrier protein) dehydratase